jgi:methylenetetrahydrofolate reductase (NADPH)
MQFKDYFGSARGPVVSFELFPPKTDKAFESLRSALPRLAALAPSYMTVTYGAMGSTRERTLEVAALIRRQHGVETASHLTCVGATREEIDAQLERIRAEGIENIVALRGDPPQGQERFVAVDGGFRHGNELVAHIRGRGGFGIAVAGYPEKHIEAPDVETDLHNLKRKVEAGADIVITQLFYENADYFRFVERVRALGLKLPVVPGLLPIQSLAQIQRIAGLCGAKIPAALLAELEAAGVDEAAVRDAGARWALEQCRELLARGAPGVHFYVLNRAEQMERIIGALRAEGRL